MVKQNNNSSHIICCRYLKCDKCFKPLQDQEWNTLDEYAFLRAEFANKDYSRQDFKHILKDYYKQLVYVFRYDMFYSAVFAVIDHLLNFEADEEYKLFILSLSNDLKTTNELDWFYSDEVWNFSILERGKLYNAIQKFTNNGQFIKKDKFCVLDINQPKLGSTLGAKIILHWSKNRQLGFVSKRDNNLFKACKKMLAYSIKNRNKQDIIDLVFVNDKKELMNLISKRRPNLDNIENKITFYVGTRLGVCDNPKYVLKEIVSDDYFKNYRLAWIAHKPELCDEIRNIASIIPLSQTEDVLSELNKSKIIIYNDDLPSSFVPNKKQTLINLWHGAINYKKIGFDSYEFRFNQYKKKLFELNNPQPDVFIAGSASFLNTTKNAFGYNESIFIKSGLPRNDILFNHDKKLISDIKNKLGIDLTKKIVLYAPTWRKGNRADLHDLDIKRLLTGLAKKFGGEWLLLYRGHTFTTTFWKGIDNALDVSNYPDSHEILLISDLLISDYSSFMYDAAIAKKPVFAYVPDLAAYEQYERGFYIDVSKWPYEIALNNEELISKIYSFDNAKYQIKIQEHLIQTKSFDKGNASKTVVDTIKKIINEK